MNFPSAEDMIIEDQKFNERFLKEYIQYIYNLFKTKETELWEIGYTTFRICGDLFYHYEEYIRDILTKIINNQKVLINIYGENVALVSDPKIISWFTEKISSNLIDDIKNLKGESFKSDLPKEGTINIIYQVLPLNEFVYNDKLISHRLNKSEFDDLIDKYCRDSYTSYKQGISKHWYLSFRIISKIYSSSDYKYLSIEDCRANREYENYSLDTYPKSKRASSIISSEAELRKFRFLPLNDFKEEILEFDQVEYIRYLKLHPELDDKKLAYPVGKLEREIKQIFDEGATTEKIKDFILNDISSIKSYEIQRIFDKGATIQNIKEFFMSKMKLVKSPTNLQEQISTQIIKDKLTNRSLSDYLNCPGYIEITGDNGIKQKLISALEAKGFKTNYHDQKLTIVWGPKVIQKIFKVFTESLNSVCDQVSWFHEPKTNVYLGKKLIGSIITIFPVKYLGELTFKLKKDSNNLKINLDERYVLNNLNLKDPVCKIVAEDDEYLYILSSTNYYSFFDLKGTKINNILEYCDISDILILKIRKEVNFTDRMKQLVPFKNNTKDISFEMKDFRQK